MDTTILQNVGLTQSQAKGYLALIEHGSLTPAELATETGETRTNAYAICDKLQALGLAKKSAGTKAIYIPESPAKLRQLLIARQKQLKIANDELSGLLPTLVSSYKLATDKPGVLYLEGVDSLQEIHDDIIQAGGELRIFTNTQYPDHPELAELMKKHSRQQQDADIQTKMLISTHSTPAATNNNELVQVRQGVFSNLDAQIMIYGPNVAISTYTNGIVTTVITNQTIADTFVQIFDGQWRQAAH